MANVDEKKPVKPAEVAETSVRNAQPDYSWAHNVVKLNRAKAHVRQTQPELKGKDLEVAVKERYTDLKGLLKADVSTKRTGKLAGPVENLADNDEV